MILVTGGVGFIGSHTVRALCEAGEECLLVQRRATTVPTHLADLPVEVAQVDVTDREALLAVGEDRTITGVCHLAVALPWPPTDGDPVDDAGRAVDGFLNVVRAADVWGAGRVVTASTIGVYGELLGSGGALHEDAPLSLAPSHVIPTFKKMIELLGGHLAAATGVEIVNARISGTWGPGGHQPDPFFAAPSLALAAARREPPDFSAMLATPHAEDNLDLCYVADTGRALALLQRAATLQHTTYNVGSGRSTTNAEVLDALRAVEPTLDVDLPSAGEQPRTWLDTARLRADTGFEPHHDVASAAADYVAWLRAGRDR